MTPERWQKIETLYHAALQCAPEHRRAYLAEACSGDNELRSEVESLLSSHDAAASFIEQPPADIAAGMVAEKQSIIGRTLGHYRMLSLLGAGGMGEVYRACDLRLERDVAVKILPEHLGKDAEALRRFEREAKAVATLSHPNILSIFDFGTENNVSYAVMELLEGETLRARLQHGAIDWRQAVEIGAAIAEGLSAAHAKGIIHRDLKPENIFLTNSGVKILDFGIARIKRVISAESETKDSIQTTRPGVVMGTLGYMSPEQVKGEAADAPSDIFSFGCVLYEMVSGARPFNGATGAEVIAAILKEDPPAALKTAKLMPPGLNQVIKRCLEKQPERRYQTGQELAVALRGCLSGHGTPPLLQTRSLVRVASWLGAALIVFLGGLATWRYFSSGQAIDSLAIMPLVNASGEATEYLSDGITETLINSLSQLPKLRVMARSTVFSYKGKQIDPRQIGRELKVGAVLTGRVRLLGDTLITQAELVNAADGTQLWGDVYQRKLTDVLAMQAELARQISEKLRLKLTGEEERRVTKQATGNVAAYQLYLKGRYESNKLTVEGVRQGIEYMNQAVALDPGYALAWVGLSHAYSDASSVSLPAEVATPKSKAAAEQALKLDDTLAEAHGILAFIKGSQERNWVEAEKEFRRALELGPNDATAHQTYGLFLMIQARTDEALREMTRAQTLEPLTKIISANLGWFYYLARRYDESVTHSQELIKQDPAYAVSHYNLGMAYEQMGKLDEAIAAYEQAQRLDPKSPFVTAFLCRAYALAGKKEQAQPMLPSLLQQAQRGDLNPEAIGLIYAALGDKDKAFEWLEKAFQSHSDALLFLKTDPRFDSLRMDARLADLVRRLNLAP
ncbi:MAG: protein kinase [Acidobacteria bacterium]|nr:protein kinase [Acidobacteriota bacterium]